MDATFYFRKKIGCAALFHSPALVEALHVALAHHPWFCMAPQQEAQIVWSDREVLPAFDQQRILYLGAVEGVERTLFDEHAEHEPLPHDRALYIPSAHARALAALIKPLQQLAEVHALQVTALFPPGDIPSMALFYQTVPMKEAEGAGPLAWELTRLLGLDLAASTQLTCLYAPITQGPFLIVTGQTEREPVLADVLAKWCAPSRLSATPSTLSPDTMLEAFPQNESFIVYHDVADAPLLRMQGHACLVGQLRAQGKHLRVCVVPPKAVLSLLACTESLVTSGAIYW